MRLRTLSYGSLSRLLCIVLAGAMATAPSAALLAQQPIADPQKVETPPVVQVPMAAAPDAKRAISDHTLLAEPQAGKIDISYVSRQAIAIATLRPQQVLRSPATQAMPVEVASAAGLKYLGLDPADVDEVVVFAEPPLPGAPQYGVILHLAKPFALAGIGADFRAHTQPAELVGQTYLRSTQLALPSFYMPDDRTLLAMPDVTLRRVLSAQDGGQTSPLMDRVHNLPGGNDLYVALDVATLRPMISPLLAMVVMQQGEKFPAQFRPLLETPNLISAAELTFNLSNVGPSSLAVHCNDEASARKLQSIVDSVLESAQAEMKAEIAAQLESDNPVERAYGSYLQRMSEQWIDVIRPDREGPTLIVFRTMGGEAAGQQQLTSTAVAGVLVALLLPAVQAAREAARRAQSMNNLKQLVLALFNYEDSYKSFPAHAIYDASGKPLLSWRVQILPYLEEQALYNEFHLDEPWDSPHNKKLLTRMPDVFQNPTSPMPEGKTNYLAVVGKECVFDGSAEGMKLQKITDGLSNTILLVEADSDRAVEWTKPADWQFDVKNPKNGLGSLRPGGWLTAFADGSVMLIDGTIDTKTLKAKFTRAGKEEL